jgi:hypothetical protein
MVNGLVKGEGFAMDASAMEANASRYRGKAPDGLDWASGGTSERSSRRAAGPATVAVPSVPPLRVRPVAREPF